MSRFSLIFSVFSIKLVVKNKQSGGLIMGKLVVLFEVNLWSFFKLQNSHNLWSLYRQSGGLFAERCGRFLNFCISIVLLSQFSLKNERNTINVKILSHKYSILS